MKQYGGTQGLHSITAHQDLAELRHDCMLQQDRVNSQDPITDAACMNNFKGESQRHT